MKPLVSPVTEYRLMGLAFVALGLVLAVVAMATQRPLGVLAVFLFEVPFFGVWMYRLALRRYARQAVGAAAPPPTAGRERLTRTGRRIALAMVPGLAVMATIALVGGMPALIGGIAAGQGAALLWTGRWLRRWERQYHRQILREPRWRWNREGEHGWGRGRGVMDPQDFYVVATDAAMTSTASSSP
ncbi:MAG: hypothetical protein QOG35_2620 [Solirubrobacteraceae bacterium]|jgi:hypothetical protein|nr:hypothetical protein [Solirubrobacteraceae bacterium]